MRAKKKVAILSAPEQVKESIKFIYYKNLKKSTRDSNCFVL